MNKIAVGQEPRAPDTIHLSGAQRAYSTKLTHMCVILASWSRFGCYTESYNHC